MSRPIRAACPLSSLSPRNGQTGAAVFFSGGFRLNVQQVWDLATARCRFGKYLEVKVNGTTWSKGHSAGMRYPLWEVVAYASLGEQLLPGELIATGTIPGCSGMEVGKWLSPRDEIELTIAGVGTLHNIVGTPTKTNA